jgi:hypothetical protein
MKELKTNKRAWLWGLPLLMLCATPACSDDDNDDPNNGSANDPEAVVDLASAPLTINNDQAELSSRVRNYSAFGTRAGDGILAVGMPKKPSVPEDAVLWKDQGIVDWDASPRVAKDKVCKVPAGDTFTTNLIVDGDYYVQGTVIISFGWSEIVNGVNIYILDGGKLILKGSVPNNAHIYSWGEVVIDNVYNLLNSTNGNPSGATLYCNGDLDLGSTSQHTMNSGTLYVGGALIGNLNNINNGGYVIVGCDSHITSDLNINSGASINLRGNLKVDGDIYMSSGTDEVYMVEGTLLDAHQLQMNNDEVRFRIIGDGYAYLNLTSLASNKFDLTSKLDGNFAIQCPTFIQNWQAWDVSEFEFVAQVLLNTEIEKAGLSIPTSCPGTEPEEVTQIPTLETIADVTPSEHTHPISATSIAVANGKIYVSWHWRGVNYHGCVEIGELTAAGCKLDQFFETAASETKQSFDDDTMYGKDFNHIMVDTKDNRIYVVGNEAKGGILGYVDLNAEGLVNGTSGAADATLKYRRLLGGDGNCIIRNGDYLQIASTYGYESYNLPNLDRVGRNEQPGKAKFILKSGNSLYGMHFNSKSYVTTNLLTSADASKADKLEKIDITLDKFDGYDYLFDGTQTELLTTLEVAPVDGKNVVAVDGNDIYVCCGAYGLVRYNGSTTERFQLDLIDGVQPRGYANGVTFDDNYVYVAYGSAGIYVLNKKDLSVYAKYTNVGGKSCNYVTVPGDGYIYVAYGENGWQVYRLTTIAATVAKK